MQLQKGFILAASCPLMQTDPETVLAWLKLHITYFRACMRGY